VAPRRLIIIFFLLCATYSIFDFDVQEPFSNGSGTATVRERLNTQAENALNICAAPEAIATGSLQASDIVITTRRRHHDERLCLHARETFTALTNMSVKCRSISGLHQRIFFTGSFCAKVSTGQ